MLKTGFSSQTSLESEGPVCSSLKWLFFFCHDSTDHKHFFLQKVWYVSLFLVHLIEKCVFLVYHFRKNYLYFKNQYAPLFFNSLGCSFNLLFLYLGLLFMDIVILVHVVVNYLRQAFLRQAFSEMTHCSMYQYYELSQQSNNYISN